MEYFGAADAEHVVVAMGSGVETLQETIKSIKKNGRKIWRIGGSFIPSVPECGVCESVARRVKRLTVLDRTKESGAVGEPLYLDVVAALAEAVSNGTLAAMPKVLGGRYGLSSKEFSPAMAKAVLENETKNHFAVGIEDDVTNLSLDYDPSFDIESDEVSRCVFIGLGADGTVGQIKTPSKIIADGSDYYGQAYFVYDSKKSGGMTTSHLAFFQKTD